MGNKMGNQSAGTGMNPPQIQLSLREVATSQQVNTLLGTMGMLITALDVKQHNRELIDSSIPQENIGLPGEAIIAAENTFIAVCSRLDEIIGDTQRWDTTFHQKVEADYAAAMKLNLDSMEAHRRASVEVSSPHSRMNPTLVRLRTGDWAAFVGQLSSPSSILGIGPTPEACLQAFDEAFSGRQTDFTRDWLQKHGVNNDNKVDPSGNGKTPKPTKKRNSNKRGSKIIRPSFHPDNGETGSPS